MNAIKSETDDRRGPVAAGVRASYIGDYELLRTLGEGGIGIVFEARQRSLNRIVALKMIPAGPFAGEIDRRRFRNEAEAVAKLDHPHIVPIYEVGEHEGHNYFSMKRIEGTNLAADLSGYRDRPREAARMVATVAGAVHHAHQRGVLHRDIKPSNVLLDPTGEPHLTDFGLAKRLEGLGTAELTCTGAILGTPAYMAPEQASGQRGDVTTTTDVYGLGALLYALLTGHAPCRGDRVADILLQAREGSPEPIRKSNAKVPRDLETICMRCLEREPRRRYASADAVAEELEHWLRGEPITARPVGWLERSWMWCRRNRLVAGLTASVSAVLILGTAISSVFAVNANTQAWEERRLRDQADHAVKENRAARDEILGNFARSLIRPLDAGGDANDVLGRLEVEALWRLAGDTSGSLGLRFLEESTRGSNTTRRLCSRTEPALIAAVGLDPKKREQALALLMKRLGETGLPLAQRADIALTALELTDHNGPEARTCEDALTEAIQSSLPGDWFFVWENHLAQSADRLEPGTAGRLILQALKMKPRPSESESLTVALAKVAGRLEPDAASQMILQALEMKLGFYDSGHLALALAKVTSRQVPPKSVRVCGEALHLLTEALTFPRSPVRWMADVYGWNDDGRSNLADGFAALAARMPRGEAIRLLAEVLVRVTDSGARQRLAAGMGALITRMSPDDVADIPPAAVLSLADALSREADDGEQEALASSLARLAKDWRKPKPSDIRPVAHSLAKALKAEKEPERRGLLAWALAPMAECLGPDESAPICLTAAESLSSDGTRTKKFNPGSDWYRGLVAMMIRLPTNVAAQTALRLATAWESRMGHGGEVRDFLAHFDANDAARIARVFVAAFGQDGGPSTHWWLGAGLCTLAEKMGPDEAAQFCAPVLEEICGAVAADDRGFVFFPTDGFAIVASRQAPAVATRSARVLADALKQRDRGNEGLAFAEGLAILAGRMEPAEAQRICGEVARVIADAVKQNPDNAHAGTVLATLARRMEPAEARRICGEVARVVVANLRQRVDKPQSWWYSATNVAALASRMEPVDAHGVCGEAFRILFDLRTRDKKFLQDRGSLFVYSLGTLAAQLEQDEAGRMLAEVEWETLGGVHSLTLVTGLLSATARIEPAAADRIYVSAIRKLLRARSARTKEFDSHRDFDSSERKTSRSEHFISGDLEDRRGYDSSVAELLSRLEPQEAGAQAASLATLICSEGDTSHGESDVLSRIVTIPSPAQRALRSLSMAMHPIGLGMGALPAGVSFAAEPWPPRLSTQALVDLLKMPTCFGKTRRVVLDHLGNIHGRRFDDHWEFVRFARENHLSLDLATPPRRPDLAALAGDFGSRQ